MTALAYAFPRQHPRPLYHADVSAVRSGERSDLDTSLVRRVANGDADALRQLYERYGRLVYSFAHRFTSDATLSEEATQDTFVALWRKAGSYDASRARLSTWLFVVARNRAIELGRQKTRRPELRDDVEVPGTAPDPSLLVSEADASQRLAEAMAELPDEQLEVLRLSFFDGLSHAEIADSLSIPLGTVKGRMRLALSRMRTLVDDETMGDPT
jgi:RNA polymerase sigma-70 factor (ECF subfamily)